MTLGRGRDGAPVSGFDPMSMLDVIEDSRQEAMERRERAVEMLATFALKALVEGHDVKEITRRCGFAVGDAPEDKQDGEPAAEIGGLLFNWGQVARPQQTPEQGFAAWLGKAVQERVEEGLK